MTINFQARVERGFIVDSPLKPLVFPDGAVHITGFDDPQEFKYQIADIRGLSHDELFVLAMWSEVVAERGEQKVLILPYLPGARMDRGTPLGSFVYAEFIKKIINPDQIITIDPHSKASTMWFPETKMVRDRSELPAGMAHNTAIRAKQQNFLKVFPVERIIRKELQDPSSDSKTNNTYAGVIAPDKGAHDRAAAAAEVMGVPVYTGGKTRDFDTGKLTGFHMEDELPAEGKFLIVDDICDGGGTFIGLAKATGLPKERLDLWVTHGIFSKGFTELLQHFETIHTTDSYLSDSSVYYPTPALGTVVIPRDRVKVHKLVAYLYGEIDL